MNFFAIGMKRAAVCAAAAALIIPQTGCAEKEVDPVTLQNFYFDTVCSITVYNMEGMSQSKADSAIYDAFDLCSYYENLLSKTKEGSDIYKINHAGGAPVECNDETIELIQAGIHYGDLSDGLFDITIGKAEDLWHFDDDNAAVPDADVLADAVKYVDYKQIQIDGNTVTMGTDEGEIDLGGIAKGYIADKVCENLKENGVTSAIVSLGGNIDIVGGKESNVSDSPQDFNIGIETPYSDQTEIVGATKGQNITVVTSGVYERYFEEDGVKYHHILDPKTGYPVDTDVLGVTIVAPAGKSMDCDAIATICLLKGVDKGMEFIESQDGYEALFISTDESITKTDGFNFTAKK